jgi:hypothetical protein
VSGAPCENSRHQAVVKLVRALRCGAQIMRAAGVRGIAAAC